MNKSNSTYTPEKETTIRRRWLGSFYAYAFCIFCDKSFAMALAYSSDAISLQKKQNAFTFLALLFIASLLFTHYYFGYKKRGTRLLWWIAIIGGLKFLATIPGKIAEIKDIIINSGLTDPIINYGLLWDIGELCIMGYYLINCWKLYSLNTAIKYGNKKYDTISDSEHGENDADAKKN